MATKAMIMAAGIGSRLEPLTTSKPKPMVPVANIPVMEHILKLLKKHNITEVIANTHYLAPQISSYFTPGKVSGLNLEILHEEVLSGTAGGVKNCEYFLRNNETFVVMSGDSLTDVNLSKLIEQHKKAGALVSMGLKSVPKEEVVHLGVVVTDNNGKVTEFQEKPPVEEAKSTMVNTGIYIFEPELFDYIPKDTFYDFAKQVFPAIMNDNKPIYGFEIDGYWNDIGTLLQYRITSQEVVSENTKVELPGDNFSHGKIGANTKLADNVKIKDKVLIGKNCNIGSGTEIKGNTSIGHNCQIEENVTINGCVTWDNVQIGKNSTLNNCLIGKNVSISNNVTINKNAVIADNCIIKEGAIIEAGTKVKQNEILV